MAALIAPAMSSCATRVLMGRTLPSSIPSLRNSPKRGVGGICALQNFEPAFHGYGGNRIIADERALLGVLYFEDFVADHGGLIQPGARLAVGVLVQALRNIPMNDRSNAPVGLLCS